MSDNTYIGTATGWIYLATIIDLYSRMITGWKLANNMRSSLVYKAIDNAKKNHGCLPKIFHSDRGAQYVLDEAEAKLKTCEHQYESKGQLLG